MRTLSLTLLLLLASLSCSSGLVDQDLLDEIFGSAPISPLGGAGSSGACASDEDCADSKRYCETCGCRPPYSGEDCSQCKVGVL